MPADSTRRFFDSLALDFAFGLRTLRRSPLFAIAATVTLGIGLGLAATPFTLFNAYVLRTTGAGDPSSLYQVEATTRTATLRAFTWTQYEEIRSSQAFTDAVAWRSHPARAEGRNLNAIAVSSNYFSALGVPAFAGRALGPGDSATAIVLGFRAWKNLFAGDPEIIGRAIVVNGRSHDVIGIAPAQFTGLDLGPVELFLPLTGHDPSTSMTVVGRLRPGLGREQARAATTVLVRRLTAGLPPERRAIEAVLVPRATPIPFDWNLLLRWTPIFAAFGTVLAIGCANVSGMLLARAVNRRREIAIRISIGASRSRLIRQLISEALPLAAGAAAIGLAVSHAAIQAGQRLLLSGLPPAIARLTSIAPLETDWRVALFLGAAAFASVFLFALLPAMEATGAALSTAVRGDFGRHFRAAHFRNGLLVVQVSVCLTLTVVTGMLIRGGSRLRQTDLGYDPRGVQSPILLGSPDAKAMAQLEQALAATPGVRMTAAVWPLPMREYLPTVAAIPEGSQETILAGYNLVSREFFPILHLPILRGRNFGKDEAASQAPVVIVSQATAARFWPGQDPLGKRILLTPSDSPSDESPRFSQATVVGVTKDIVSGSVFQGVDATKLYFPVSAGARPNLKLLVRDDLRSGAAVRPLETVLATLFPDRPTDTFSLDEVLDLQVFPFRLAHWIGALLGAIALLLSASAVYAAMAYQVSQRTKEIGIRMALGATPASVVWTFMGNAIRLSGVGLGVGFLAAFGIGSVAAHFLPALGGFDAIPFAAGGAVVSLAALLAAYAPTNRAAGINPVDAMREQ